MQEKKENLLKDMDRWNVDRKLEDAPDEIKGDREFMIRAMQKSEGFALHFASEEIRGDKAVVMTVVQKNGYALGYASEELRGDKAVVLAAIQQNGDLLKHASEEIGGDKEVQEDCHALCYTLKDNIGKDKEVQEDWCDILCYGLKGIAEDTEKIMTTAVTKYGVLEHASEDLRNDKAVVLVAVQEDGRELKYASEDLRNDKAVVLVAVQEDARALEYASEKLRNDKAVVLAAVQQDGGVLIFASNDLRSDKEVIIAAVRREPTALKFALNGLNQDRDCLKAAGLFDEKYDTLTSNNAPRIVLSTKFSLSEKTTAYATEVALQMKAKSFFEAKVVYSPNAWDKNTCDPKWTDINHPCRGTPETCGKRIFSKDNVPIEHECCWRSSFHYQLTKAKETGGFMVQVAEFDDTWDVQDYVLGNGQQIETELAEQLGLKVFRIHQQKIKLRYVRNKFSAKTSSEESIPNLIDELVKSAEHWDKNGRDDMSVEEVFVKDIIR